MSILGDYPLKVKLLLVPAVAALSFAVYLIYSTVILSDGNTLLMEISDTQFPILNAAGENVKSFEGVVESLNTAAATGEPEFLQGARDKANEIRNRYDTLQRIDAAHRDEIEKLRTGFQAYYSLAYEVALKMSTRMDMPSPSQIEQLRILRDSYSKSAISFRDVAEKEFKETIRKGISRSERAQYSGTLIGSVMLLVIAALTMLVNRGIVALEEVVENRNRMLVAVNDELKRDIQKLKKAEQARIHAEAVSQIKDDFLANMSHELRTPMNAVIGLSHLCLQTDLSEKQHDYLRKINNSAKSLLGILNDILDVSKIEAGKMEMDRMPFELEEVMGNLATIVGIKAQEKNLEFLMETSHDVPKMLVGDPLRLGQVLINFTGNAVKFTEKGEVIVRVELEHEEGDQVILRFTVQDTGIGMTRKEIDKLFKPFAQADTSITRKFGGTGLGLTISKRLVKLMGGDVGVESAPGKGARFIFTAHFRKADQQAHAGQASNKLLRGLRVLAVDDNKNSLKILRNYLENFTFDVTVAGNGLEALKAVRMANDEGKPFSLMIVDWKMPQMSGIELANKLHEMTELSLKPKLLLITGYGQHQVPPQVDGILEKPFQQSKLFDAVAKISGWDNLATGKFMVSGAQFNPVLVSQFRGARILLVEDDEINQQVAREMLENYGIGVTVAENGEEAISALKAGRFDGVLMDMQMPVMDGLTAARTIRSDPQYSAIPIIALTANVMVSEQNEVLAAGMNDHIGKPIDPDRLVVTLAKWVHPVRTAATTKVQEEVPKPVSPVAEAIPDMHGMNVAASVRRIGGDVALYYSLLEKFRANQQHVVFGIRKALAANDAETSERLAHTLKGLAGTLGAASLQSQAEQLESRFKNKSYEDIEPLLVQVEGEVAKLIASIDCAIETRKG